VWGIGKYRWARFADDAAGGSGAGTPRLFPGGGAAGGDVGAVDYASYDGVFRFLCRGLLLALAQLPDGDGAPGAVRRGGAVIFIAARSRLHDAGDSGVPDGTGFGGVNRGQRFSALL